MSYISETRICPTFPKLEYVLHFRNRNISYISKTGICPTFPKSEYVLHFRNWNMFYISETGICPTVGPVRADLCMQAGAMGTTAAHNCWRHCVVKKQLLL